MRDHPRGALDDRGAEWDIGPRRGTKPQRARPWDARPATGSGCSTLGCSAEKGSQATWNRVTFVKERKPLGGAPGLGGRGLGLVELRAHELQAVVPELRVGQVDADQRAELLRALRTA